MTHPPIRGLSIGLPLSLLLWQLSRGWFRELRLSDVAGARRITTVQGIVTGDIPLDDRGLPPSIQRWAAPSKAIVRAALPQEAVDIVLPRCAAKLANR